MKKQDVEIGGTYRVKVSGKLTDVKVLCPSPYGGWEGLNLATNKPVRIRTAARLRFRRYSTSEPKLPTRVKMITSALAAEYPPSLSQAERSICEAEDAARQHAMRCRSCSVPIIDPEGNPGYFGEACKDGLKLLVAYCKAMDESVPAWVLA